VIHDAAHVIGGCAYAGIQRDCAGRSVTRGPEGGR
jgi:hypothetical protein